MSNYALGKALRVLSQFGALHPERSVTELSRVTGLSKSNVSKILREFRTHGFLEHDQQTRRYRVGPQALLGSEAIALTPLAPTGQVEVRGEIWKATLAIGAEPVAAGARVIVRAIDGLTLTVAP